MYNVSQILKKYAPTIKKKFGQNFLIDNAILNKIVNVLDNINNREILEIGAGPGGLTNAILQQNPKKLLSVEIDKDYYNILKEEFKEYSNYEVINEDALKIDETRYFTKKINVIANLPYNIGTSLLLRWFKNIEYFESFTLLLQKEVVERIIATPCTKEYGRLSVIIQAFSTTKKMFDLKPTCFTPPPKVMSSVVSIIPKQNVSVDFEKLSKITLFLFNNRRKKIKQAIEKLNIPTNLDLNKRAEELSVGEFIELSKFNF